MKHPAQRPHPSLLRIDTFSRKRAKEHAPDAQKNPLIAWPTLALGIARVKDASMSGLPDMEISRG